MIEKYLKPKDENEIQRDLAKIQCPVDRFICLFKYHLNNEFLYENILHTETHYKIIDLARKLNEDDSVKIEVDMSIADNYYQPMRTTKINVSVSPRTRDSLYYFSTSIEGKIITIKITDRIEINNIYSL